MNLPFNITLVSVLMSALVLLPLVTSAQEITLGPGDKAPSFTAMADNGEEWNSADHVGDSIIVLFFYPAAMTGGCTAQACSFRDNRTKLTEMGAEVVGISGDTVENQRIFKITNNLNFPLLSDTDGSIARSFGVPVREGSSSITREVDGEEVVLTREVTTARWTFIIDRNGTIVYKDTQVDAAGDSDAVIAAIERLAVR
jgi:thioredoxin-dependent peroxiredoxin